MKRIVCLILVVLITCAGCEVKERSTSTIIGSNEQSVSPGEIHEIPGVTIIPRGPDGWSNRMGMYSELRERIERVETELSRIKIEPKPDRALLVRIADLGAEIDSQRTELRTSITKLNKEISETKRISKPDEALLVKVADLEAGIKSLRTELRTSITKLKEELSEAKADRHPKAAQ